jgi:hypothetical protein
MPRMHMTPAALARGANAANLHTGGGAMETVVGAFGGFDEAKRVADDLLAEGFRDGDVSVVASRFNSAAASGTGTSRATTGVAGSDIPGAADADATIVRADARELPVTTDGGGLAERVERADEASGASKGAVTGGILGGTAGLAASLIGLAIPGIGPLLVAGPIIAALTGAGVGAVAGGLIGALTDVGVAPAEAEYYAEAVRRGGAIVTVRTDPTRAGRAAEIMREHGAIDIEQRVEEWRDQGWTGYSEREDDAPLRA